MIYNEMGRVDNILDWLVLHGSLYCVFVLWKIVAVVFICILACAAITDLNATTSFFGVYDGQVHENAVHNHCFN